jgi:hypothetical protein
MLDPFDVFKLEQDGSVRWLRAIADLEHAKTYVVKILVIAAPADYLILNQRTGERTIIQAATQQHDGCLSPSAPFRSAARRSTHPIPSPLQRA